MRESGVLIKCLHGAHPLVHNCLRLTVGQSGENEQMLAALKAARAATEIMEKLKAGDRLTEREFEQLLKGSLGLSNSQAERAARVHLKGQGEPAEADQGLAFLRAMTA